SPSGRRCRKSAARSCARGCLPSGSRKCSPPGRRARHSSKRSAPTTSAHRTLFWRASDRRYGGAATRSRNPMLVAIAALLAAASPTPAPAPQPAPARVRSLTAVRAGPDAEEEGSSQAADAVSRPAPQPPASRSWYSLYPGNRFGLLVDAGVPVGLGLSGMFRPWSFLRLEGGINWNYL